jgi:hypothetical protein
VLHHREADEHDEQHQGAEQRGRDQIALELAGDREAAAVTQTASRNQVGISITARS